MTSNEGWILDSNDEIIVEALIVIAEEHRVSISRASKSLII